ncbi:MAG: hypothetical protein ACRCTG_14605 [Aestuariivirga sp.]
MLPASSPAFLLWNDGRVTTGDKPLDACRYFNGLGSSLRIVARIRVKPPCYSAKPDDGGQRIIDGLNDILNGDYTVISRKVPAIPEGFIPHDGGLCPVAEGARVAYILRARPDRIENDDAGELRWSHGPCLGDIIAYKPERSPDFRVEAGKFYIDAEGRRVRIIAYWCAHFGEKIYEGDNYKRYKGDGTAVIHGLPDLLCLASDQTTPMVSE